MAQALGQLVALLRYCITGHPPPPILQVGPTGEISGLQRRGRAPQGQNESDIERPRHGRRVNKPMGYILRNIQVNSQDSEDEFVATLTLAVDREAARKSMESQVQQNEKQLEHFQSTVEETTNRIGLFESHVSRIPRIQPIIDSDSRDLLHWRDMVSEYKDNKQLLKTRLAQWDHEQSQLLRRLYEIAPAFLHATRETHSGRNLAVPEMFAYRLRMLIDSTERLNSADGEVERLRKDFVQASRDLRESRPGNREHVSNRKEMAYQSWRQADVELRAKRVRQRARERTFFGHEAPSFLTQANLMHADRRISDLSSVNGVVEWGIRPPEHWSRSQTGIPVVGDGMVFDTKDLNCWLWDRAYVARRRRLLEDRENGYTNRLATYLYSYPALTQEEFDIKMAQLIGQDPHAYLQMLKDNLEDCEERYEDARNAAVAAGIEDLPLSPDWAASDCDVPPSQGSEAASLQDVEASRRRAKLIRRWNRAVTRKRPFGANGGPMPPPPVLSPASFRTKRSPSLHISSPEAVDPTLSPGTRKRRVLRMEARGEILRHKFERNHGLSYGQESYPTYA